MSRNDAPPSAATRRRHRRVCLAYSGGLDTSVAVPWLLEHAADEVICFVGDVGQGDAELEGVEEKAKKSGAARAVVVDQRQEFVTEFVLPALAAGAVYEHGYLMGTSIARPCLARGQVRVAKETGCDALAHGCTGKGNDQVRFEMAYAALAPELAVVAPWRDPAWTIRSREDALAYAQAKKIPVPVTAKRIYSRDRNLLHISHEGGALEDPASPPPDDVWTWTADPKKAPSEAEEAAIAFEAGVPVSLNGKRLGAVELLSKLNDLGAKHGVGRIDLVENRFVGMKSRGCYETPGGTILHEAYRGLEELVLDREGSHLRGRLAPVFADLVYDGKWFTPAREALGALFESLRRRFTGSVRVRCARGAAVVIAREAPRSLFQHGLATFGAHASYDHADATGFLKLVTLPSRTLAQAEARSSKKS